ncbi:LytTR family transcriptional regulator DNA-binding domain-containing protein [Paenibacillus maysiensis]|uniref:LytTR family transcriptional regulator DNA-binding domain-containing protein n=1 Tax=Paenibacillus maysiensis TaxID=1155954 RepID=UPI000472CAC8|nr:LytTR family transcriptional regulator DNA-binding domain-containing protein [Paenibacillus maysiensis]
MNRIIFGIEIDEEGNIGNKFSFPENQILYITLWEPKRNYKIPVIYTRIGAFTVATTLRECVIAIPKFVKLQNNVIINPQAVSSVEETQTGAEIILKNGSSSVNISTNKWETFDWSLIFGSAAAKDERILPSIELDAKDRSIGSFLLNINDIELIEIREIKKNYELPTFTQADKRYTIPTTLNSFKTIFPYFASFDKNILVNLDEVDYAEKTPFDIIVRFKDSFLTTHMAGNKEKHFKFLFK